MRLKGFDILVVHLPSPIRPRSPSRSVLVRVHDDNSLQGWGETCPRSGVDNESAETARDFLHEQILPPLLGLELESFEQAHAAMQRLSSGLRRSQLSAFCAAELAVLDLAGHHFGCSAGDVLGPVRRQAVHYSGLIDARAEETVRDQAAALRKRGVSMARVKLGGNLDRNLARLDVIQQILGPGARLIVDPDQRWDAEQTLHQLGAMAAFHLSGIIQPVPASDLEGMVKITAAGLAPVIASSQVGTVRDVDALADAEACDSISVGIANVGGLGNARLIHAAARASGLGCQLDAPAHETGLLTAAGRLFGTRAEGVSWLQECGSLNASGVQICKPGMAAGPGGRAHALAGPGLGMSVLSARVEPLISHKISVH